MNKKIKKLYRVTFVGNKQIYEIYAKHISQSEMFGFLEVEDIVFGENSSVVVDPAEEKLKIEFSDVNRFYVPMQAIMRIDEVEKEGPGKIIEISPSKTKDNVTSFSSSLYKPNED